MLFFPVLGCVLHLGLGMAHAQQQESRMEKILKPDPNKEFILSKSDLFGQKSYTAQSAQIKEFYFPRKFNAKDYLTGSFSGNKSCWMGDFKYALASSDPSSGRVVPNATKQYDTKSMAVKASSDSEKKYGVSDFSTKSSGVRGKSQDKFDARGPDALTGPDNPGWKGSMAPMDIQQVRELLNKTK